MSPAPRKTVIVGAGGHARVVASILAHLPDIDVVGVADRTAANLGEIVGHTKIVTTFDELPALRREGVEWVALAIGDNSERAAMFATLQGAGFSILTARHPTAWVESDVRIGTGSIVCAGAIVASGVVLADDVLINTGAIVDHECVVGAHVHIGPGARVAGRVTVGERAFIGAGTTVRDRVRISAGAIIGAGSVVVDDIPGGAVAYGVPARVRRDS